MRVQDASGSMSCDCHMKGWRPITVLKVGVAEQDQGCNGAKSVEEYKETFQRNCKRKSKATFTYERQAKPRIRSVDACLRLIFGGEAGRQ